MDRDFGSVRNLPSGRWQARYRGPDGKRRPAPMTFKTKREASRWLTLKEAEVARGEWVNPDAGNVLFGAWGRRWLDSIRPTVKPKTYASYLSLFRTQVEPHFGRMTLASIRPITVSEWVADMNARGLSASRIRQAHVVLSQIMQTATVNELIRISPCIGTKLPRLVVHEPTIITKEQGSKLVASAVAPHDLLIEIMLYAGLRVGEVFALRRKSIDLDSDSLRVSENLIEIEGRISFGTPKNHQVRDIQIPEFLTRKIRVHMEGIDSNGETLLFVNRKGNPLHYNAWRTWRFDPAVKEAGLDITPHDLRASHASWVADEFGVLAAGRRLGHSNTTITTRHYARRLEGKDGEVARGLNQGARATGDTPGAHSGHGPEDENPPDAPVPA
ncbi:tyrosine-type recombinase/integrase [Actinomadura xylanilytica]|uniref:tyrosine-type recombinase/integrase n=1 Tax=Actinomadura xylanilytica TaxID=887459 RepID=UPI00255A86B1|nr:site-specific integrase [Actinomadura xylanilytica]MDL4776351.1 site-specific integrase [Actinomadura xylanilytica]